MSNLKYKVKEEDLYVGNIIPKVGQIWGKDSVSGSYAVVCCEKIDDFEEQYFLDRYEYDGEYINLETSTPISEQKYLEISNKMYGTNFNNMEWQ